MALAIAVVVSLAIWVRSTAAWIALPIDAIVLAWFGVRASARARMVFAQLVGVSLAIDTWSGKGYLFTRETVIDGQTIPSDAANVAHAFGSTYWVWGLAILAVSLTLLAAGLYAAWWRGRSA